MERTESIGSIDTVYRNESVDIIEYNPQPNPDSNVNPIIRSILKQTFEPKYQNENNQISTILLNENEKKSRIPNWYYIVAGFAVGFFIAAVIIVLYDYIQK